MRISQRLVLLILLAPYPVVFLLAFFEITKRNGLDIFPFLMYALPGAGVSFFVFSQLIKLSRQVAVAFFSFWKK